MEEEAYAKTEEEKEEDEGQVQVNNKTNTCHSPSFCFNCTSDF